MDNYPEARSFYMERAWSRRSEFRRRQKKFVTKLVEAYVLLDADNSVQMALDLESKKAQLEAAPGKYREQNSKTDESDNIPSLDSDDDFDVDFTDPDRKSKRNYSVIKEKIDEKVSRFFYNVDVE